MANDITWKFINHHWDTSVVPTLSEYIEIPNVSPLYDPEWATNGYLEKAAELLHNWAIKQDVKGLTSEILHLPHKTPLIFFTILPSHPDVVDSTVLMYGHLDKQPPMTSTWKEGLHPYKPVLQNGLLYGRGGADDGYAIFAAILSIKALQEQGIPHGRIVILIEASEESGSIHLIDYIEHLKDAIGTPSFIVCLDSGAGNYDELWTTTSLRGMLAANLTVRMLHEGHHSGAASGIVPSTFRILRLLLDRIESPETGEFKIKEFKVEIPPKRIEEAKSAAGTLGDTVHTELSFIKGTLPVSPDPFTLLLNRNWKPTLSITGIDGLPPLATAGNVHLPYTSVKLSIRLPPSLDPTPAREALTKAMTENVPYNAKIEFEIDKCAGGFDAPPFADWVTSAMNKASNYFFHKPTNYMGEGGSIPFMGLLKKKFPDAQFVITGVLGPQSNAHGPNEFLHIEFGKKVNSCVISILADHGQHFRKH